MHSPAAQAQIKSLHARKGVWYLAFVLAFVVCLAVVWVAWYEKNVIIQNEHDRAALFARVLEDQVGRTFTLTSQTSAELGEELAFLDPQTLPRLRPALQKALTSLSAVRSLSVLDREGKILLSTRSAEEGQLVDLKKLIPAGESGYSELNAIIPARYLGDLNLSTPRNAVRINSLPLIREVQGAGENKYLLVALINPDFLSNLQALALGGTGYSAFLVVTRSSQLLAGFNTPLRVGEQVSLSVELPGNSDPRVFGTYTYTGAGIDTGEQVFALRSSRSWPVTTIVERPVAKVLGAWFGLLAWFAMVASLAILVIIIMTFLALRSQRARDLAQSRLVEQLSFTEKLLEISPLPIYMVDEQGTIVLVNRALETFVGIAREQLLNRSTSIFLSEADLQSQQERNQYLLSEGGQASYERQITMPDGTQRDIMLSKVVVSNDDGLPRGVLTVVLDVTRFREAERATLQARDAAENASRTKSEFISNMSHELRTPLQSILGFSELGLIQVKDNDKVSGMFRDIYFSGQRMLALVNDLLDIAKIESALSVSIFSDVVLENLIDAVASELEPLLLAKGLKLEKQFQGTVMTVHIDVQRIHQVVRNVLANAIKFSPAGTSIEIRLQKVEPGCIRLSIADKGCGIPADELEKIFEPFVQSSLTKDGSGGTGLGLAICRRILQAHQGSIHAENRPDGGAVFFIDLPMPDAQARQQ